MAYEGVSDAQTPAAARYRMPAEWEPHEATWLSWPNPEGISFPGNYDRILPVFAKMVDSLAGSERVRINVADLEMEKTVRGHLAGVETAHVEYCHIPTNEPWCRDHGAIFVVREEPPSVAAVNWDYNAWGGKYPPFDLDDAVPSKMASLLEIPVFDAGMVLEGGSIDVNGAGALLTTEACLLNPNRNPTLTKQQIEQRLHDYLGVKAVLWLGDGIEGDDTDGHVDDITRFVNRTTVVTAVETDSSDRNFGILQDNIERLKSMRIEDGTPLHVLELPMPPRIERDGRRLPASYANFYIANTVVLLPVFGAPQDAEAESVLQAAFPTRKIVGIDCRELIWGLGAFHCLTQQQPKPAHATSH